MLRYKSLNYCMFIMLVLLACRVDAGGGVIVDQVVKVIDGDTIEVNVSAWPDLFGRQVKVRLRGVDTPELRGKCVEEKRLAREARDFVYLKVTAAERISLVRLGRGSFFRVVADVLVDGVDLGRLLIKEGLGRVYEYKTGRGSWCAGSR